MSNDSVTDPDRLSDIASLDLFSAPVRRRLDELCAVTAEQLAVPAAMVSIVLDTAQYIAGSHGLEQWLVDSGGTPVEWSFCATAVRRRATYVVEDAAADADQCDNPLVTEGIVGSYAGAPLITEAGYAVGAVCVLDATARHFDQAQLLHLEALSAELMSELELFRSTDGLG